MGGVKPVVVNLIAQEKIEAKEVAKRSQKTLEEKLRKRLPRPSVNKAVREVSERRGVHPLLIVGTTRQGDVVAARNEVFAILNDGGMSYAQIGLIFGKDHTSIRHGVLRHRGMSASEIKNNRVREVSPAFNSTHTRAATNP